MNTLYKSPFSEHQAVWKRNAVTYKQNPWPAICKHQPVENGPSTMPNKAMRALFRVFLRVLKTPYPPDLAYNTRAIVVMSGSISSKLKSVNGICHNMGQGLARLVYTPAGRRYK